MKRSHSYEKCYKLLNINIDCSWEELRKAYRTLVHKWHPDRCVDDKEKALATDKLKDLNTAYKQLSDYYNKHGVLPLFPPPVQAAKPSPTVNKEDFSYVKATKVSPNKKQIKSKRKSNLQSIFIFAVVVITMAIIYPYLNSIVMTMSTQFDSADEALLSKKNIIESKTKKKKKKKIETKIETEYFTYGSTLGEVVLIQGPPDKTNGDIWFYGESEIHFEDGLVVEWLRTPNNPLKAKDFLIPDKKKIETKSTNFK
ncbi:MAG: J domain-containing protein [Thermodesulfovibrionia bacterium]|nr:J domain-containing protein [Thermodesulfovibrionia bacterium]